MNHIELFAGCGGLCLGLTKAGFTLTLANELSPMAAETFAYNFFGENLLDYPEDSTRTLWIESNFARADMRKRLREDPRTCPVAKNRDLADDGSNLEGSLVVGTILSLNSWLEGHPEALQKLKSGFGQGGVDLVSGGPPCQSFSLAGLREKNNAKNSLPWAFAKFVELVQPKSVLLENVSGILRPFNENGKKYHAWFEITKAFVSIGYVPLPLHINAKFAGVAQNRPRFILICLRHDVFESITPTFSESEKKIFEGSKKFYELVRSGGVVNIKDISVLDLNNLDLDVWRLFRSSFLAPLATCMESYVSVQDAIGDLKTENPSKKSTYVKNLNNTLNGLLAKQTQEDQTNRLIVNQPRVRRRFRIYQILAQKNISPQTRKDAYAFIAGKIHELSNYAWQELRHKSYLLGSGCYGFFDKKEEFEAYLKEHLTKKQTQRALVADQPAPAALSIPDDACHYSELRTLSAREMARIQSFPDGFKFRSKMTTGGSSRQYEVPIYTQIGNAVPVLLGVALGNAVKSLLNRL